VDQLDDYLESQAAEGAYQDTGSFVVDFSKARSKSSKYTLAKSEQWVIRLMQGFARLGAASVDFEVGRKWLTAEATFAPDDLIPDFSDLFRLTAVDDPRFPFQDAVWGSLSKGLRVEFLWWESGSRRGYKTDGKTIEALSPMPTQERQITFRVTPLHYASLLFKIFGTVNYGAEFAEISRVGYLVPFRLNVDGRPYDFELDGRDSEEVEVRVQPAREGLRIKAPASPNQEVSTLGAAGSRLSGEATDYGLLLKVGWGPYETVPLLHWVVDGIRVESHALRDWESHLWIELYLPADGFRTDLTRLKLVQSKELAEHRRRLERFAVYSLLTAPPLCLQRAPVPDIVARQVKRFAADIVNAETFKRLEKAGFKNETTEHQNRLAIAREVYKYKLEAWQKEKEMHEGLERVKADRRSHEAENLRFGALASGGEMGPDAPDLSEDVFDTPKPTLERIEKFLGEIYVRLPRTGVGKPKERPHVPHRHRERGR
jgi:hypothetical protein